MALNFEFVVSDWLSILVALVGDNWFKIQRHLPSCGFNVISEWHFPSSWYHVLIKIVPDKDSILQHRRCFQTTASHFGWWKSAMKAFLWSVSFTLKCPNKHFAMLNWKGPLCNQLTILKVRSAGCEVACFQDGSERLESSAWETWRLSANCHNARGIWHFSAKLSSLKLAGLSPVSFCKKLT